MSSKGPKTHLRLENLKCIDTATDYYNDDYRKELYQLCDSIKEKVRDCHDPSLIEILCYLRDAASVQQIHSHGRFFFDQVDEPNIVVYRAHVSDENTTDDARVYFWTKDEADAIEVLGSPRSPVPLRDGGEAFSLLPVHGKYYQALQDACDEFGRKFLHDRPTCLGFLESEDHFIKIRPPVGYETRPLEKRHAVIAWERWAPGNEDRLKLLINLIENGQAIGLFEKSTDTLACWAFMYNPGCIGVLHTVDEFRGQGLAKAVISALTEYCLEQKMIPHCFFEPTIESEFSKRAFKRCGFKIVETEEYYWGHVV